MADYVYINPPTTEYYQMVVTQSDAGEDFSLVTAATFQVLKPDGTETTWTATIPAQSATQITLRHLYQSGDVDIPGPYVVKASMTTLAGGAGAIRSEPARFMARNKFQTGE